MLNKIDAIDQEMVALITTELRPHIGDRRCLQISAATRAGLDSLMQEVWQQLDSL